MFVLRPGVLSRQARTDEIPGDEASNHNTFILYHYLFCFKRLSLNASELSHFFFTIRDLSNKMLLTV
jgi:hypothetical protein